MDAKNNDSVQDKDFTHKGIDLAIKLGAIALVLITCQKILSPFILPIAWGGIIAIALYPFFKIFSRFLGDRHKLAATIIVIIGVSLVIIPTVKFSTSAAQTTQVFVESLKDGSLEIPAPNISIKEWPLIGQTLYDLWLSASENLESFISTYADEIKTVGSKMLSAAAGIGGVILQFILSMVIAAIFMVKAEACSNGCQILAQRFMDKKGRKLIDTSIATIRSVAVGILGIAIIQALLSGLGMLIAGIPAIGIWVIVVLFLAIVQLPPLLILGPIAAYYFSVAEATPAIIFLIWCLLVSSSDAVLKPIFLGRGMDTPMIVILLGAIGGMITAGIIGLFVGAVFLALGYELMNNWLEQNQNQR